MQHSSGCHTSLRRSTLVGLTWDGGRVDTMAAKRRVDQELSRWVADNINLEMQTVVFIILVVSRLMFQSCYSLVTFRCVFWESGFDNE
jgi:hypothetical protein